LADISPSARTYVVEVVCGFVKQPHAANQSVYLIDLLRDGLNCEGSMRTEYLRITGDMAMFVSGIFPDSLDRQHRLHAADLGYVMDIGQTAYNNIPREPFAELAYKFPEIIEVLNVVGGKIKLVSKDIQKYVLRRRYIDDRIARRQDN
jgi:hypothetical protein